MGIAAKTQSHCHQHHALSTSFSHVGLRKTSIGVCEVHFMPRMCITAYRSKLPTCSIYKYFMLFFKFKMPWIFLGGGGWYIHSMWNFPNQESNPHPLQWKHGVLPTRPPGKSKVPMIKYHYFMPIKAETVLPKGNLISHCKTYPSGRDITMWGNAS